MITEEHITVSDTQVIHTICSVPTPEELADLARPLADGNWNIGFICGFACAAIIAVLIRLVMR